MIKITKLRLTNYRGVKALDIDVAPGGFIARGRNGAGKSTAISAIGAALASADIGPDAVRLGEDGGEILVDLDVAGKTLHARRRFGANGSTLKVTTDEGDQKSKPTQLLADLLGTAPLDVVGVVLEKDRKKRREKILAALPVKVTVEQLRRWVPNLPENYDVSGHGLEVIERLRAAAYNRRTEANKVAKERAEDLARAEKAARDARSAVPELAPGLAQAMAAIDAARAAHAGLIARRDGRQLFGACVDRGELHLVHLGHEERGDAAAAE